MTLFRRVNDILTANLNDLIDRFEDPEKMLRQAMREMDDAIAAATSAAARSIAGQKLLSKEIGCQVAQADGWQHKAMAAVAAGNDDQARRALVRRREHQRLAGVLEEQRTALDQTSARLRRRIEAMKIKRAEAGRMRVTFGARQCAARAFQNLGERSFGDASNAVFYRFEHLRQRVELAEAESEALFELAGVDEIECSANRDREDTAEIDAELAELRRGRTVE